jgi:GDP-4-dehydro-6-deoxy-D-mannose reductase
MRLLITGATGFVGGHLAERAAAGGARVVGVARGAGGPTELESVVHADLTDPGAAEEAVAGARPDAVAHLAAQASVPASWTNPNETIQANAAAAANVLEAVRRQAAGAIVLLASSSEIYGAPADLPVDEAHPLRPQNPYAVSKACADLLAGMYADVHGLRVVRARSFNHAGPRQSDAYVVSAFARQIAEAEARGENTLSLLTGNLEPRRDITDVRDVVRAYLLLLERGEPGVYNVCSGTATRIADLLAGLSELTGVEVEPRTDPARTRAGDVMEIRGSHARLTEATGWAPEIPLSRTLADTLAWWRRRLSEGPAG